MVTIAQAQRGIAAFVDAEISPNLSSREKLAFGSVSTLVIHKLPQILGNLSKSKIVSALELYSPETEEIDIDAVYEAIKPNIGLDPIPVKIPYIGLSLKFTEREAEKLYKYIKGA